MFLRNSFASIAMFYTFRQIVRMSYDPRGSKSTGRDVNIARNGIFFAKYSNKVSLSSGYWGCTGNKFPSELSTFSTWKKECCQRFHDSMCIAESAEEFSTSSHELLIQVGTKPHKRKQSAVRTKIHPLYFSRLKTHEKNC